jgi:hypothetical protein
MDDSTPQDRHEYLGDVDGAAGGASEFFGDDEGTPRGGEDLSNLRELDLRDLVRRALAEVEVNLPAWEPGGDTPRRQAHALDDALPGERAIPVRLQNGSSAWLEITDRGAQIYAEPLRSDRIILALLTDATIPVDHTGRGDAERLWRAARVFVLLDSKGLVEPFDLDRIVEAAASDSQVASIEAHDLFDAWKLRPLDALIRHYCPNYAVLREEERVAVLVEVAKRMDAVTASLRELQGVLEEGRLGGLSRHRPRGDRYKGVDPQRDAKAAELRDALNLTHRQIAAVLDFPLPPDFQTTGKVPAVRNAIERGRKLLKQALPNEGEYDRYLHRISPELKSWYVYISTVIDRGATHCGK